MSSPRTGLHPGRRESLRRTDGGQAYQRWSLRCLSMVVRWPVTGEACQADQVPAEALRQAVHGGAVLRFAEKDRGRICAFLFEEGLPDMAPVSGGSRVLPRGQCPWFILRTTAGSAPGALRLQAAAEYCCETGTGGGRGDVPGHCRKERRIWGCELFPDYGGGDLSVSH